MARNIGYTNIGFTGHVTHGSALTKHTDEDKLVKISADKTVALCAEGDNFHGIVRIIDGQDKAASVQEDGYATMLYEAGKAPSLGWDTLVCGNATNKVAVAADAVGKPLRRVVDVDETAGTCTFKVDCA